MNAACVAGDESREVVRSYARRIYCLEESLAKHTSAKSLLQKEYSYWVNFKEYSWWPLLELASRDIPRDRGVFSGGLALPS